MNHGKDWKKMGHQKNILMETSNTSIWALYAHPIRSCLIALLFLCSEVNAQEIEIFKAPDRRLSDAQMSEIKLKGKAFHFSNSELNVFVVVNEVGSGIVWQRVSLYAKENPKNGSWDLKSVLWAPNSFVSVKMIDQKEKGRFITIHDSKKNVLAQFSVNFVGMKQ